VFNFFCSSQTEAPSAPRVFAPPLPGELAGSVIPRNLKDEEKTMDNIERYEILTAMLRKIQIFWDKMPY